jgi:predicted house-cleaning noncanonical NTP pyrophosphatase (MazG superfamily)
MELEAQISGIRQRMSKGPYRKAVTDSITEILIARVPVKSELEVVELRPVSKGKAEEEILEYYKIHKEAYPSDVADALRIDYNLVWEITEKLKSQGRLGVIE